VAVSSEQPATGRSASVGAAAWILVGVAILSIWASVILTSALAHDLVTGSQQEHLPLVAFTAWLWGAVASALVFLAALQAVRTPPSTLGPWVGLALGVAVIWAGVFLAAMVAPDFVTGSDPTRIPLIALAAPIVGVFLTWFVCAIFKTTLERPA
jgi:hypothetical protein